MGLVFHIHRPEKMTRAEKAVETVEKWKSCGKVGGAEKERNTVRTGRKFSEKHSRKRNGKETRKSSKLIRSGKAEKLRKRTWERGGVGLSVFSGAVKFSGRVAYFSACEPPGKTFRNFLKTFFENRKIAEKSEIGKTRKSREVLSVAPGTRKSSKLIQSGKAEKLREKVSCRVVFLEVHKKSPETYRAEKFFTFFRFPKLF